MRSDVVESRPPQNVEIQDSAMPYQPEYRKPEFDPRSYKVHSAAYKSRENQAKLVPGEGWLALLLVGIAVYSVVFSIIFANWVNFTYTLLISTAVGLLLGLCIAKIPWFPQSILHLAAVLLGHWLSIWLVSTFAYHTSWLLLLANLRSVIFGGLTSPVSTNSDMVFLFYLTFLSFFLAYFGVWLIYRAHFPWLVALIYCAIMLVNLNYIKQDLSYLLVVMLAALSLLIVRMQLTSQLTQWTFEGLYIDRAWLQGITRRFVQIGALFTLLILLISLMLPMLSQPTSGTTFWNNLDNIWANISHGQISFTNPGSLLQPYQAPTNFFGDQLSITGDVNLPSGQILYYTTSSATQPQYLEGLTYDNFDGHTWTSTSDTAIQFEKNRSFPLESTNSRKQVATNVTMIKPPEGTRYYIFAPAQPLSFNVPTALYGNGIITAWTQQGSLTPGEKYQAMSLISTATAQDLSTAQFPPANSALLSNLGQSYVQTPADLKNFPIVQSTLHQWVQGSTDVYSKIKAIESHLSDRTQFAFSVKNPPVPTNVDAAAWLLQTHQGYCTYYATTMVVMVRMLGIPARIVNGFTQGSLQNKKTNTWIVNGTDAHSWVQVYFPSYGWINFDPTPGYSVSTGSTTQQSVPPVKTPPPTKPTPIATPVHQKPQPQPTPRSGVSGTGKNTSSDNAAVRQNLFLMLSLLILLGSLAIFGLALFKRYRESHAVSSITASMIYRRVCRLCLMLGMPPQRWQTPYEYYRMLGRRYPETVAPMQRLTELFVRERWAPPQHSLDPGEGPVLEKLWHQIRKTLIRSFFARGR
ncbi:MAG TPA: transglutaminaseTgpA domain-containing protein, partial [Ktedonobacteraceae bacterium]|nr:transglutaminaseTgpA domain-containing protein [Ktedonobacteraceae bacterium]